MIYVVSDSYNKGFNVCIVDLEVNPANKREVTILSTNRFESRRLRGRQFTSEDTIVWIGDWHIGRYAIDLERDFRLMTIKGSEPKNRYL